MAQGLIEERIHPTGCKCKPLAYGQVSFWDGENGTDITHRIAVRAIRVRDCPIHGATNGRCSGQYLPRMLAR